MDNFGLDFDGVRAWVRFGNWFNNLPYYKQIASIAFLFMIFVLSVIFILTKGDHPRNSHQDSIAARDSTHSKPAP